MDISTDKIVQVIFLSREGARASTELRNFIAEMNEDEQATLVAVAWVGRDTFDAEDYEEALRTAREEATTPTADYLMGMPHLAENLEYGMDRLGIDVTAEEDDFG
jgi:hypothetical protein